MTKKPDWRLEEGTTTWTPLGTGLAPDGSVKFYYGSTHILALDAAAIDTICRVDMAALDRLLGDREARLAEELKATKHLHARLKERREKEGM